MAGGGPAGGRAADLEFAVIGVRAEGDDAEFAVVGGRQRDAGDRSAEGAAKAQCDGEDERGDEAGTGERAWIHG